MADMPGIMYQCDPAKNKVCKKDHCHINGGQCTLTKNKDFAVDPSKVTLILPADEELLKDTPNTRKSRRKKK